MNGERPARVPDALITSLHARECNGLVRLPPAPRPVAPLFVAGDQLRVRSGVFSGLHGLFVGQAPHERVCILLNMLGGKRVVEIARTDVSKIGPGIGTGR